MPDNGFQAVGGQVFSQIKNFPDYYAGDYVFEWDGDAHGILHGHPRDFFFKENPNRIRFSFTSENANTRALRFTQIKNGGFSNIRLYRSEHEELLEQGKIWNPAFIELVSQYDIIRTMDMQSTNNSPVRSFDDIATPESPAWGSGHSNRWPPAPYYSVPYEVLFNLGVETERSLWVHIPPQIGSQKHHSHPSMRLDDRPDRTDPEKLRQHAAKNTSDILDSPEWDKFADNFISRLAASGYPKDRPLYVEVGNEIWNFGGGFVLSTYYAWGIGDGALGNAGMRKGYGILTARWMLVLEQAMDRSGEKFDIRYVLATHTAWPDRTNLALGALRDYLKKSGADHQALMNKVGVTLTTYYGCLLYTSPSPRDLSTSRMPSSA